MIETATRFVIWICGKMDQRYGECLYGVYHAEAEGTGKTLCGQSARETETRSTKWWKAGYGSTEATAEGATCKACRRAAGLETRKWEKSQVML
jgi:hypothetical protein